MWSPTSSTRWPTDATGPGSGNTVAMSPPSSPRVSVVNDVHASRYELRIGGELVSFADYSRDGNVVTVPHVETAFEQRGNGYADLLMSALLDDLRAWHSKIRPLCSFAAGYLRDHPDDHDLIAER